MSGADGTGPPLVAGPRRGAIVSTGNYDQRVTLPAVERALGGARLRIADAEATAAVEVPTAAILSALSPLGAGRLTCRSNAEQPVGQKSVAEQSVGQKSVDQQLVGQQSGGTA
jgi:hypothetical protein